MLCRQSRRYTIRMKSDTRSINHLDGTGSQRSRLCKHRLKVCNHRRKLAHNPSLSSQAGTRHCTGDSPLASCRYHSCLGRRFVNTTGLLSSRSRSHRGHRNFLLCRFGSLFGSHCTRVLYRRRISQACRIFSMYCPPAEPNQERKTCRWSRQSTSGTGSGNRCRSSLA